MKRPLSLVTKLTLLVSIPIVLQLLMLLTLIRVHEDAERQLQQVAKAQRIVSLLNEVNNDVYELLYYLAAKKFQVNNLQEVMSVRQIASRMDEHLSRLAQCDPEDHDIQLDIEHARHLKVKATHLLVSAAQSYSLADGGKQLRETLKNEVNATLFEAMTDLLPKISAKQAALASSTPAANQKLRSEQDKTIFLIAVVEFLFSICGAYVITKSVVKRISKVNDNTYRLAANMPLNPPDNGSDEIASLDSTLHRLASALDTVSGRETLLVENAFDAIVTMDKGGRIINVNQATLHLLGHKSSDMIGSPITDYAIDSSQQKFRDQLSSLKGTSSGETIDLQFKRLDGQTIDVTCSIKWFAPENCFFCIIHDITEQLAALRLKNEVVEMVSHDLKAPLSTVDYILSLFAENESIRMVIEEDLVVARRNVKRIIQLVLDFLDAEKLESKMYQLSIERVQIEDIFNAAADSCRGLADQKIIELAFTSSRATVSADSSALTRVMTNLITNAIQHSPRNSKVCIDAQRVNAKLQISIMDEGPGLRKELLPKIFDRFYQAPGAKAAGSSGLGLTICKLLVELGGGEITAQPNAVKAGTTFSFTVPLSESTD